MSEARTTETKAMHDLAILRSLEALLADFHVIAKRWVRARRSGFEAHKHPVRLAILTKRPDPGPVRTLAQWKASRCPARHSPCPLAERYRHRRSLRPMAYESASDYVQCPCSSIASSTGNGTLKFAKS